MKKWSIIGMILTGLGLVVEFVAGIAESKAQEEQINEAIDARFEEIFTEAAIINNDVEEDPSGTDKNV